jgi:predicted metal-dependent hydrolase
MSQATLSQRMERAAGTARSTGKTADPRARHIPTRRISFEESLQDLPQHFAADGDLFTSHTIASLSAVFPDGEDFFVRSVRYFRDQITDPELKRQVAGFIGQESVHGREHRTLNDRLDALGYPTKRMERFTRKSLGFREGRLSAEENLAVTAALEHFTATFAEVVLGDEEARRLMGSPELADLLVWHAIEECEHKAVAFDVYQAVGGSEQVRVRAMNITTFAFIFGMSLQTLISVLGDKDAYRRGNFWNSFRRFLRGPFFRRSVWRQLRDYNRPGFHPDDHDTEELLSAWREELFGDDGRLNNKLANAA